ncbi:MAG TPA: hypothetical protein VF719_08570 [Abditibacteriaceae bacterium]|jgi:hypothetical protein
MQPDSSQIVLASALGAWASGWVAYDCGRRGRTGGETFLWSAGTFLALIIFLPVYLWVRTKLPAAGQNGSSNRTDDIRNANKAPIATASRASTPCKYCGVANEGDPFYCAHCSRQLKGVS